MTKDDGTSNPPGASVVGERLNLTDEFFQTAKDKNLVFSLPTPEEDEEYRRGAIDLVNFLGEVKSYPDDATPQRE